jgi:putative MFS transporter
MINAYSIKFKLTDTEISTIGLSYFVSKAIGALFTGYLTKWIRRMTLIFVSLITTLIVNVIFALIFHEQILFIERLFSGLLGGIMEPIINNMLCEFLPVNLRGFTLLAVWIGYNIGQLCPNLIMLVTMPRYQTYGIQTTILISSMITVITFIICWILINDSPRNYILNGNEENAFSILEKMKKRKLIKEEKELLINETKTGANKEISNSSFWEIFRKEWIVPTICISILSFTFDLIYDGPVLIMDITLKKINGRLGKANVLREAIIVILFTIPSSIVGGMLMEVKNIGRTKTILLSFCFLIVAIIPALFFVKYMYIFFGFYQFFANFGSMMIAIYASELYPTKIRDFSVGFSVFLSNMGSAISQFIFVNLEEKGTFVPYYFVIGCCVLGCITCSFLTIETYRRPLDVEVTSHNKKNKSLEFEDEETRLINLKDN